MKITKNLQKMKLLTLEEVKEEVGEKRFQEMNNIYEKLKKETDDNII